MDFKHPEMKQSTCVRTAAWKHAANSFMRHCMQLNKPLMVKGSIDSNFKKISTDKPQQNYCGKLAIQKGCCGYGTNKSTPVQICFS